MNNEITLAEYKSAKGEIHIGVEDIGDKPLGEKFMVYGVAIVNGTNYPTQRTFTRDDTEEAHLQDARAMLGKLVNKSGFAVESDETFDGAAKLVVANVKRYIAEHKPKSEPSPDSAQRFIVTVVSEKRFTPEDVVELIARFPGDSVLRVRHNFNIEEVK